VPERAENYLNIENFRNIKVIDLKILSILIKDICHLERKLLLEKTIMQYT